MTTANALHPTLTTEAYRRWCGTLTLEVTGDPLWRMSVYRLSLFILDLAWDDAITLDRGMTREIAAQLYGAVASISANIADGYGRQSGRDRARFYEYALSSTREAVVWYRAGRKKLGEDLATQRTLALAEIRRLLLIITPAERQSPARFSPR